MTGPIKILLTASEDFGKAEIEITATDPQDALAKVTGLGDTLVNEVIAQQTLLAKGLKASHGLSPEPTVVTGSGSPQDNSWQQPQQAAQPPAWAQQQSQQQQQNQKACHLCHAPLNYSTTKRGGMFKCPNYKGVKNGDSWVEGGNGHTMEFVN